MCIEIEKEFEKFIDDCDKITIYYIPSRYPSLFIEKFSEKDAKYSVKKAREIINFNPANIFFLNKRYFNPFYRYIITYFLTSPSSSPPP